MEQNNFFSNNILYFHPTIMTICILVNYLLMFMYIFSLFNCKLFLRLLKNTVFIFSFIKPAVIKQNTYKYNIYLYLTLNTK